MAAIVMRNSIGSLDISRLTANGTHPVVLGVRILTDSMVQGHRLSPFARKRKKQFTIAEPQGIPRVPTHFAKLMVDLEGELDMIKL